MPLEDLTGIKFVGHLVPTNPAGGDDISQGDDHIRGVKNVMQQQFGTATDGTTTLPNDLTVNGDLAVTGSYPVTPSFSNLIMNGAMQVAQRVATTHVGTDNLPSAVDRFKINTSGNVQMTTAKVAATAVVGEEFTNALEVALFQAEVGGPATNITAIEQRVEGQYLQQLAYGTGAAKTLVGTFHTFTQAPGIYSVAVTNTVNSRTYINEITLGTSVWEKHTVTVPGDVAEVIPNNSGIGLIFTLVLKAGADHHGTVGNWQAGTVVASVNQVDFGASTNTFTMTGVMWSVGAVEIGFEHIPFDVTLNRCERYFQKSYPILVEPGTAGSQIGIYRRQSNGHTSGTRQVIGSRSFSTRMRATPVVIAYSPSTGTPNTAQMNSGDSAVTYTGVGDTAFGVVGVEPVSTAFIAMRFDHTADAEL